MAAKLNFARVKLKTKTAVLAYEALSYIKIVSKPIFVYYIAIHIVYIS